MPKTLSSSDRYLLGQLIGFAERNAADGVYCNFVNSTSRGGLQVGILVALGDEAAKLQQLIMSSAAQPERQLIEPEQNNGQF